MTRHDSSRALSAGPLPEVRKRPDADALRAVWSDSPLVQLDNPVGGILRPANVRVTFGDVVAYYGQSHAVFAGRGRGRARWRCSTTPSPSRPSELIVTAITAALLGSVDPSFSGIASGTLTAFPPDRQRPGRRPVRLPAGKHGATAGLRTACAISVGLILVIAALSLTTR